MSNKSSNPKAVQNVPGDLDSRKWQEESDQELMPDKKPYLPNRFSWQLFAHLLVLSLSLLSIWIIHLLLGYLLGKEAKFFDIIPIRYIIDVADVLVIAKFLWAVLSDFREES